MSTPHKQAEILHAIADGNAIESRRIGSFAWYALNNLSVLDDDDYEHRIKPHRWQAEIDAQKAGKVIQIRGDGPWFDDSVPNFGNTSVAFRIKPEMLRFRMYKYKSPFTGTVSVQATDEDVEGFPYFVSWIGDWQEVEA